MESKVVWQEGMAFEAHLDGFNFAIDADENFGGQNKGPRPKGLTLISLAGCTAMDVISILKKMRVQVEHFEVGTESKLTGEHPKKFTDIVVIYKFRGKDLPLDKIQHAVELSMENYCGVSATLKPVVNISRKIFINDKEVS
ncbi:MAG: OsmC family protein [Candidatus Aminicenantes bacterium]|nr:OsmC family protein [Candidatus Aminicenantes bacterium]